jgi:predicted transposase YbfD/YdcC
MRSIVERLSDIPDPRRDHPNRLHKLCDIVLIVVWCTLANIDTWEDMEDYVKFHKDLFERYLELPNGIPSHDTLSRTFAAIDPVLWQTIFAEWMAEKGPEATEAMVLMLGLDGKQLRGTRESGEGKTRKAKQAFNAVTLWASEARLVIKQAMGAGAANEATVGREVLKEVNLKHTVVSMDAMHAQAETLDLILEQGGDYLVSLKKNNKALYEAVAETFKHQKSSDWTGAPMQSFQTVDVGHGRQEKRVCYAIEDLGYLEHMGCVQRFSQLHMVYAIESTITRASKTTCETKFYATSMKNCSVETALSRIRGHWSIENQQHYILDVSFDEDHNRTRENAAKNLALVRRAVLNLLSLEQHTEKKISMARKRRKAAMDHGYAIKLLGLEPLQKADSGI